MGCCPESRPEHAWIWKYSKSISACTLEFFLGYGNKEILYRRPGLRKSMPPIHDALRNQPGQFPGKIKIAEMKN
jgi:hypothetical protein